MSVADWITFERSKALDFWLTRLGYFVIGTIMKGAVRGAWIVTMDTPSGPYPPALVIPTVTTDAATEVEPISSTLNGTPDDDGGEACDCGSEWGETAAYEHGATPTQSRTTGHSFARSISGLSPSTPYHFRAFATNAAGTGYGADRTFTTGALPPGVTAPDVTTNPATGVI